MILAAEAAAGDFIRANHTSLAACTDLSDGGLALAAFEMADHASLGLALDSEDTAQLFGEDQARYLIAATPEAVDGLLTAAKAAGVALNQVGVFGGDTLSFGTSSAPLADLSTQYNASFAATVT